MSEQLDWVQRRALRTKALYSQSGDLWREVCEALARACESYNHHYSNPSNHEAKFNPGNGRRVHVARTRYPDRISLFEPKTTDIIIVFNENECSIEATGNDSGGALVF